MEERLQKILSQAGICSRRRAEEYLSAGRVAVNGKTAALGDKALPERDRITLDGVEVLRAKEPLYLMINKPRGCVTTLFDEKGRKCVADLLHGVPERVWPVGRLDMDSEGLLILCNDGALTQRLTHPSHEIEKEYHVRVTGDVAAGIPLLEAPMELDGQSIGPAQVALLRRMGETSLLSVVIHEGKNRQVRRMCAQAGLTVQRLKRVREGGLALDPALMPGQWKYLTAAELACLDAEP